VACLPGHWPVPDPVAGFDSLIVLTCVNIRSRGLGCSVGHPMLIGLSQEIRDCHARAEACEEKARRAFTEEMREDFLQLRDSWLKLARSYEFTEQLLDFTRENARLREKWRPSKPGDKPLTKLGDKPLTKPGDTPLKPRDKLFK
jgi:hypothetical protein